MIFNREEYYGRIARLTETLARQGEEWDTLFIVGRENLLYFTGTMQDSVLALRRGGEPMLFVRRSWERAREESPLNAIFPMRSYRDMAEKLGQEAGRLLVEKERMPIAMQERICRAFAIESIVGVDGDISRVRARKSPAELEKLRQAGAAHEELLLRVAPTLLREGMEERELMAALYAAMLRMGHEGSANFAMFQTAMPVGQFGFGETTLYPTSFDGPGGMRGLSAAAPFCGSRRELRRGDLVFIDIPFTIDGYSTDKTQVYCFGGRPSPEAAALHAECMAVQQAAAAALRPGALPAKLYEKAVEGLSDALRENFMGFGSRSVRFLGHGVGLNVDEYPVIAGGFTEPLEAGMAIALEPKCGIAGVGTVGVEDTYIVATEGGQCLTGGGREILCI